MIPYLATFAISILFCAAGEWELQRRRKAGFFLCAVSVIFPVVLAAAREYTVGTDVLTYGNYVFQGALKAQSPGSFLRSRKDIELLYKALAYAVSRVTNNPHWFYFATALIICAFTMWGLLYYRRWCSVTLAWSCFLFLFYGDTLNTMRQCLALAVVFAAFPFFLEKKYLRFAILSVIAILFHVTGIIALALPVIYVFMEVLPPRWLQFLLIVACVGMILFYSPILRLVLEMKILPAKFSRYMAKGLALAVKPTTLRLPFLIPIVFYYDRFCGFEEVTRAPVVFPMDAAEKCIASQAPVPGSLQDAEAFWEEREESRKKTKTQVLGMFAVIMLLMEICTVQLRSVRPALYRISFYFGCFRFIAYSRLVKILRRDNRVIVTAVLFLYLAALWYYQNVVQGNNQIYPYVYSPGWFERMIPVMPAG